MRAMKYCLSGAAGALALGCTTLTVQAAPAGAATVDLKTAATMGVQKARYHRRRCWWHNGHRHCRRYRHYRPYFSLYGPGFGFYLGGEPRHRWHGRHHHRRHWRHRLNRSQY